MESIDFVSSLLRDLSSMLKDVDDHDVIIQVGENHNIKELRAHSNFLCARSEYFRIALSDRWFIKKNDIIEFKKPNINPTVFETILEYIYTGELHLNGNNVNDISIGNILELIVASDELLLEELLDCAQDCLIKIRPTLVREELSLVIHTIFPLFNCKKLQDHCVKSISTELQSLNYSKEFLSLDKDILFELLKRDDFLIEETIVWDYLIKWGIEQTPSLGSENNDRTKWNDENYEALKETLSKFIPLIRFPEISSKNFCDKVHPFKAIIPNHIYEEALEFYMKGTIKSILPPRIGTIDIESKIINPKLAYVIANWIEKKDATAIRSKNSQYKFNLLYRSSKDGFHSNSFRFKCKNHGPCFILIKPKSYALDDHSNGWVQSRRNRFSNNGRYARHLRLNNAAQSAQQRMPFRNASFLSQQTNLNKSAAQQTFSQNSTKIYGEYYPLKLNDVWHGTTESFIFSFGNDDDTKNMKICRMNYNGKKYQTNNNKTICFGFTIKIGRNNLFINNSPYNDNNVLKSPMRMPAPEEVEIFEIISS
ncbi:hypothetical protein RclHR1_00330040 [Rhizophagus clarus]|uniref:BTB domain-containing protein n=1 Tax=Rhizophagus clarus TaxID=94130 RepID=A0A2Z6R946_9GLOM|nr:hypothetical protein RclHR1_00330040 [Rhizophagus clarus]GES81715.1 hypothetical protein GLOIN_2v1789148 [Rhizophagus clarus]